MKPINTDCSLKFFEFDAAEAAQHPNVVSEITADDYVGVVIRGALSPEQCRSAIAALDAPNPPVPRSMNPYLVGWSHGRGVAGAGDDMDGFLDSAATLSDGLAAAFGFDVVAYYAELLGHIAGGRRIDVPRHSDGRIYSPLTARAMGTGGGLPMHCGNEVRPWPAMSHLATVIGDRDQLSFFTQLAKADSGGELVVYDIRHTTPTVPILSTLKGDTSPECEARDHFVVPLGVGDMVLFNGGVYYHRISRVVGPTIRWTFGAFAALDVPGEQFLFWS